MIRPLAWFAAFFSAGIVLAQYLPWESAQPLLAAAFAVVALVGLFQRRRERRLRLMLAGFAVAAALGWNMGYTALVQTPALVYADEVLPQAEAIVERYAEPLQSAGWGERVRYRIRVQLLTDTGRHNAYLYAGEELTELAPGNLIRSVMAVSDASRIDEEEITSFTAKNVYLLLFPKGEMTVQTGDAASLRYLPQRTAHWMEQTVQTLYDDDTAALVLALLTGNKGGFDDELYSVLSEAGILHIASVSGLHCMFLLSMVQQLLGKRKRLIAALGVPLLLFYAVLTGASPSVLRAVVMMLFLLAAPLFGREYDRPTAFCVALMLILFANPFAAASVSLQLSFAAVAGMMWLTPKLYLLLAGKKGGGKGRRLVAASVSSTVGALVLTTPLSAWYFGSLVLVSPVVNLLLLPVVNVLFSLALLTLPIAALSPAAAGLLVPVARVMVEYVLAVARKFAAMPYHAVYFQSDYLAWWLAFAYLLLAIVVLRKTAARERRVAVAAAVLTLMLTVTLTRMDYHYGEMNIVALDVGQGQSVLVSSGGEAVLIDCGSSNNHISAGDVAGDMIQSMNGGHLDYLVLTHFHTDHTDGLPVLLARVQVDALLIPRPQPDDTTAQAIVRTAQEHGVEICYIESDQNFSLGNANLCVFAPVEGLSDEDENENGLTILCTAGDFDFLITGDMGMETECALLEQKWLPDIELMMVGHHGSNGSSSEELLAAVRPETAIVSVGENSYGHPTDGALQRLAKYGVELYRTDWQGNVRVTVN